MFVTELMQEATRLSKIAKSRYGWLKAFKVNGIICLDAQSDPIYTYDLDILESAHTMLDGKWVFTGDELYHPEFGKVVVTDNGYCYPVEKQYANCTYVTAGGHHVAVSDSLYDDYSSDTSGSGQPQRRIMDTVITIDRVKKPVVQVDSI